MPKEEAVAALAEFWRDWPSLFAVELREGVVRRAGELAWRMALRGYDAVHLASALTARETLGASLALATFDRQLWEAAQELGMAVVPEDLDGLLAGQ